MLNSVDAIRSLKRALDAALTSLRLDSVSFGRPEVVEKVSLETEAIFQGFAKAKPSKEDAYRAALAFLRGEPLDENQNHLIAGALCEPISERHGARVLADGRFPSLLSQYEADAKAGALWRLTWYGLLTSYFAFDLSHANSEGKAGWTRLQETLQCTWPYIDAESGHAAVPVWVKVMRQETEVLSPAAADKYAAAYLDGHDETVKQLAEDLGIPQASWFWQTLVLGAVRTCCRLGSDTQFKSRIPRLIELISAYPVFRDDAIELILTRYQLCNSTEVHPELRDYVVQRDVWRNPKLRHTNVASGWNRVSDDVWRMALGWVNEKNLKLFFELLAGRSGSDEGRLEFWSRYLDQISWTKLVFGAESMQLARRHTGIQELMLQEEGTYAELTGTNKGVDAFMMQIGEYVIVEFSQTNNRCFIYPEKELPFKRYANTYAGDTTDLKKGYEGNFVAQITHRKGWETNAELKLRSLGIEPDESNSRRRSAIRRVRNSEGNADRNSISDLQKAPPGARFTMETLRNVVAKFPGAFVNDMRSANGGRLWVEDPQQRRTLANTMKSWGFRWADSRSAWYFPPS